MPSVLEEVLLPMKILLIPASRLMGLTLRVTKYLKKRLRKKRRMQWATLIKMNQLTDCVQQFSVPLQTHMLLRVMRRVILETKEP